jgi:hypothetical protein
MYQKVGEGFDAGLDPPCALRRMSGDVITARGRGHSAGHGAAGSFGSTRMSNAVSNAAIDA